MSPRRALTTKVVIGVANWGGPRNNTLSPKFLTPVDWGCQPWLFSLLLECTRLPPDIDISARVTAEWVLKCGEARRPKRLAHHELQWGRCAKGGGEHNPPHVEPFISECETPVI